jgi:nucleoside-diphosphate-sugar epimerase
VTGRAVVTGAAGFIGSHLVESLLAAGHTVTGVDAFTPYYDTDRKRANLAAAAGDDRFTLVEADLAAVPADELDRLVDGADAVYHLAAQPGVRPSWATFGDYVGHNVLATHRLLDAARRAGPVRLVYGSSSSVYGNAAAYPTVEDDLPRPHSPYGVTKLAAEHLCVAYAENFGVPTVSLRFFTVYGPRQRPDMAMHRLCAAALGGPPFPLYGSGEQERDFTYVADVVAAVAAAGTAEVAPGTVLNVAGGQSIRLSDLVELIAELAGRPVALEHHPAEPGDVARTGGSVDRARALLGWEPKVGLREGLGHQLAWHRQAMGRN